MFKENRMRELFVPTECHASILEQWKIFSLKNLELMLSNGAQNTA
jgi:hypothetical protein